MDAKHHRIDTEVAEACIAYDVAHQISLMRHITQLQREWNAAESRQMDTITLRENVPWQHT